MKQTLLASVVLGLYALSVLALSRCNRGRNLDEDGFLHMHRRLPWLVAGLSFLSSNFGALEVVTVIAVASRFGMLAVHFYWIGAIPALSFLLCVLLPRYRALKLRTIPDYLGKRFSSLTGLLSAISFCLSAVVVGGITVCLAGHLLTFAVGLPLPVGIFLIVVLAAVFLYHGGTAAVLQAEAVQILVLLLVLTPLAVMTLQHNHGLSGLLRGVPADSQHTWVALPWFNPRANLDVVSLTAGLGVVLGFTYWCGDFLLVQRLCATRESEMLRTPELSIAAKLIMPVLLVVPGLALAHGSRIGAGQSYDLSLPLLLTGSYQPLLAVLAVCTLVASSFLGFCGQVSGATAIFMSDIYPLLRLEWLPGSAPLRLNRSAMAAVALLSGLAATFTLNSRSLMETLQVVLSLLNVPVATVFMAGVLFSRLPRRAGTGGILAGTLAGFLHWRAGRLLGYQNGLSLAFHGALYSWLGSMLCLMALSLGRRDAVRAQDYSALATLPMSPSRLPGLRRWAIGGLAMGIILLLYVHFR